jgi:hypothetical protein
MPEGAIAATIDAAGFNRHSFLCGQSGSGKTYSLGVVLERLLADTDLRIAILDPNADYVKLGQLRDPDRPKQPTGNAISSASPTCRCSVPEPSSTTPANHYAFASAISPPTTRPGRCASIPWPIGPNSIRPGDLSIGWA